MRRSVSGRIFYALYTLIIIAFLVAPIVVVLAASLTSALYLTFPPHGLSLRWYKDALNQGGYVASLEFSLWMSAVVATLSAVVGYLMALGLGAVSIRRKLRRQGGGWRAAIWLGGLGVSSARVVVLAPLMLPVIVLAVALLQFFSNLDIVQSELSILLGQLIMCIPFGVLMSEVGLANVDPATCLAAESLGARAPTVLRRVVAPLSFGGLAGAWAFSFVVAFGDSTVALILQGPGRVTAPVNIFNLLYFNPFAPTVAAMAGILAVITLFALAVGLWIVERTGSAA